MTIVGSSSPRCRGFIAVDNVSCAGNEATTVRVMLGLSAPTSGSATNDGDYFAGIR